MGNSKAGIMTNNYEVLTIEEYFNTVEKQIVAKSLVKYLKSNKSNKIAA